MECLKDVEMHFGNSASSLTYKKGEQLHCVTQGMSGKGGYELCGSEPSAGTFYYGQNKYYGWVQVHVDEEEAVIRYRGVDDTTEEIYDLFEVHILATEEVSTE
mmetsp:Transcript_30058/g.22320  ORF Transcript_30058/g.22320 Transcript_30058/m.22320 type:complete len:103 (+) Transcript_30058:841-1149(+)|eukprot:CAMPEP_0202957232 /NCGR_PEP_ID=MMETSP1396-20130829/1671_1 /ASSEMBLY_ACC=CAM_ASM_000872 /TAXON_ID= /ORGANISM="Pseudokeronopsis sp., Strain Brazil" /LENGTH=102 /DNA_ID=CAMNT_0049674621 /DNA_START=841 /DNA_END=1149 /DNA_ORIENTATION=+